MEDAVPRRELIRGLLGRSAFLGFVQLLQFRIDNNHLPGLTNVLVGATFAVAGAGLEMALECRIKRNSARALQLADAREVAGVDVVLPTGPVVLATVRRAARVVAAGLVLIDVVVMAIAGTEMQHNRFGLVVLASVVGLVAGCFVSATRGRVVADGSKLLIRWRFRRRYVDRGDVTEMIFQDGPILVLGNVGAPQSRWRARFGLRSIPQAAGTRLDLSWFMPARAEAQSDAIQRYRAWARGIVQPGGTTSPVLDLDAVVITVAVALASVGFALGVSMLTQGGW